MSTYIGFNTVNRPFPSFTLTDRDLIKRDILNHFHTRKGERVMQPNFGSVIHDMVFEPLDEVSKRIIFDDAVEVVSFDPRVKFEDLNILELPQGLILEISLSYVNFNERDTLTVAFNRFSGE